MEKCSHKGYVDNCCNTSCRDNFPKTSKESMKVERNSEARRGQWDGNCILEVRKGSSLNPVASS